jgi:ABC-type dipeptide/oligopeptide/nickel transport system permease subunit
MDAIDRKILALLQQDASHSVAEIGNLVGLSSTPCWKRIQRLEAEGVIQKRVALVDQDKLGLGVTPIGPTWTSKYLLGADNQGRDVAARVLYGGRASLEIGIGSAVLACLLATIVALIAGYFGGAIDSILSRTMDLIWAFPVYLLAISLATVLLTAPNGLNLWVFKLDANSLWIPLLIIGIIYVPYVYRPIRGQVLSLRQKEFVEAAIAQGAGGFRLIFSEILPNVISTVIVLLPPGVATLDPALGPEQPVKLGQRLATLV